MERKVYNVDADLAPYRHPVAPWNDVKQLPNLEEITDPTEILINMGFMPIVIRSYNTAARIPGESHPRYCSFYLANTPGGGGWDGSGLIFVHDWKRPRAFKFALCVHKKTEEGHRPNPTRGWHPGHCEKCGMDMTVDSGD